MGICCSSGTSWLRNNFFPTTPSLHRKEGSTAFPKPFFSLRRLAALGKVQASLALHSFAQPFPSGDKGCANRPFNSLYDPFGSPCRGQKRSSNRYAIRLADHQRSTPVFLCGMGPQGENLLKNGCVGCDRRGDLLKPMVIRDGTAGTRWLAH